MLKPTRAGARDDRAGIQRERGKLERRESGHDGADVRRRTGLQQRSFEMEHCECLQHVHGKYAFRLRHDHRCAQLRRTVSWNRCAVYAVCDTPPHEPSLDQCLRRCFRAVYSSTAISLRGIQRAFLLLLPFCNLLSPSMSTWEGGTRQVLLVWVKCLPVQRPSTGMSRCGMSRLPPT